MSSLGVAAHTHREELQQLPPVVLVRLATHVLVVVQPVDHGRVARELQQNGAHVRHAYSAEHIDLAVEGGHVLALEKGRGEDVVPEEGHLLLERTARYGHPVYPPDGGAVVVVPAVVAVAQVGIDVGEALGVEQVVHHVVVGSARQGLQLAAGGAEPGPPHQVSSQSQIAVIHTCSPPAGAPGICGAFYITTQPRTIEIGRPVLRGCVRSLGHVLEWRYETESIPQRPDRRTVGCSGFPTPISQDRGKATYGRPTGGRQRHCVRSAQWLHVASHAA